MELEIVGRADRDLLGREGEGSERQRDDDGETRSRQGRQTACAALQHALQKNLVNIKADYAKVPNKWNIHLIPRYSADSALSSIADKRPIFDLP